MVGIFSFILLGSLGLILKKNNFYFFIVLCSLAYLSIISTNIADFSAMENVFNYIKFTGNEYLSLGYGWWILCKIAAGFNLTYVQFKTIILILGLILVWLSAKALNIKNNFIWSLYIIYPAITDIIQLRFFLAISIVIFLIPFLMQDNFKGYFIYILGIIFIAAQIHNSAYFFLIFLFWKIAFVYWKYIFSIAFLGSIIILFDKSLIIPVIQHFGSDQENNFYFTSEYGASRYLIILFLLTLIFFIFTSIYIYRNSYTKLKLQSNFNKFMCVANGITIFIVLLSSLAFTFLRLQKPLWILNYFNLAIYMQNPQKGKISAEVLLLLYLILAFGWVITTENIALMDFFF